MFSLKVILLTCTNVALIFFIFSMESIKNKWKTELSDNFKQFQQFQDQLIERAETTQKVEERYKIAIYCLAALSNINGFEKACLENHEKSKEYRILSSKDSPIEKIKEVLDEMIFKKMPSTENPAHLTIFLVFHLKPAVFSEEVNVPYEKFDSSILNKVKSYKVNLRGSEIYNTLTINQKFKIFVQGLNEVPNMYILELNEPLSCERVSYDKEKQFYAVGHKSNGHFESNGVKDGFCPPILILEKRQSDLKSEYYVAKAILTGKRTKSEIVFEDVHLLLNVKIHGAYRWKVFKSKLVDGNQKEFVVDVSSFRRRRKHDFNLVLYQRMELQEEGFQ